MQGLQVEHLSVEFQTEAGRLQAVRDVSFSLKPGHTLALVGESGSGKSVTGRAILGILETNAHVTQGQIRFDRKDLLQMKEAELVGLRGKGIAMVFQDPLSSLNPLMPIGKQITEVIRLKLGASREAAREKAVQLLQEVGIRDGERCFRQYPHQLSGGMRQRVVIAIALAADPEILICDEPTTALDVTIQAQILELLERQKQQRGLSMLFITHDFGVVAQMADDVAVMYAGKIVEYGTVEEIFYDPRHPYTRALLSAVPIADPKASRERKKIMLSGDVPSPVDPPAGCRFSGRCQQCMGICREAQPKLNEVEPGHFVACHLYNK